jgi:hypothetical protein
MASLLLIVSGAATHALMLLVHRAADSCNDYTDPMF